MRLTIWLLGCEVFTISTDRPEEPPPVENHGTIAGQVELAGPVPLGFAIEPNPSVRE